MFRKLEIVHITRQVQLAFQDGDKTVGFLNLFINGKTGTIYSMIGRKILRDLVLSFPSILKKYGLDNVIAVVEPDVAKSIRRWGFIAPGYTMEILRDIDYAGRTMSEVRIKKG